MFENRALRRTLGTTERNLRRESIYNDVARRAVARQQPRYKQLQDGPSISNGSVKRHISVL
jgi:hypothetical protein